MGNSESSNKEAIEKARQFQQQRSTQQNIGRYPHSHHTSRVYTNEQLPIRNPAGYVDMFRNPWEAQRRLQDERYQQ